MSRDNVKSKLRELGNKTAFAAAAALLAAGVVGLAGCDSSSSNSNTSSNSNAAENVDVKTATSSLDVSKFDLSYSDRDQDPSYDEASATKINLANGTANVMGTGAGVSGDTITISEAGVYVLSGQYTGNVIVSAPEDAKVQLVLAGAEITGGESAIKVESADKVFVTLAEGTSNTLINTVVPSSDTDNNACLWSSCDLTIQGNGALNVTGVSDGIKTKDDLVITGSGSITVNAMDDAIVGHDSFKMKEANVTARAVNGDAVKVKETDKDTKGFASIDSGTLTLNSRDDDGISTTAYARIAGGSVKIDVADKGIVSDNAAAIEDGDIYIKSNGDGVHAEQSLAVDGGKIEVGNSNEGLEAQEVTINDGQVVIIAKDDGINASPADTGNESESSAEPKFGPGSQGGGNPMMDVDENCKLVVNGGYVYVDAGGDALDSNGSIELNGGTIALNGPENDGNSVIDSGTSAYSNGATVLAIGSSGMFESFSSDSKQAFLEADVDVKAGDVVAVVKEGKVIIALTASKNASKVTAAVPGSSEGDVYKIVVGGGVQTDEYGVAQQGVISGGSSIDSTVTLSGSGTGFGGIPGGRPGNMTPPSGGNGAPPQMPDGEKSGQAQQRPQ